MREEHDAASYHGAACLRSPASQKIQDRLFETRLRRSHIVEQGAVREGQARRTLANSWVFPEYVSQGGVHFAMQGAKDGGSVRRTNFCTDDTDHQAVVVPAV